MSGYRLDVPRFPTASTRWIDRWLAACSDLVELERSNPMTDAVIEEIDGRMIRVGDQWLADFASCNYLGFDLDREIIDAVPEYLERWGTHPSWSRMLGSPVLYTQIEERLTELLGCEDTLVIPTITLIHLSVIPVLAGDGTIFVDNRAHKTIYDGCQFAVARGATVKRFRFEDPDDLEQLLRQDRSSTRLICMDGVNSMTGNAPDLREFARLARRYDSLLYVDDAHGFGVIGERAGDELSPYGRRGNSVVRYCGETYDRIILVGGFSKAYSSLAAFVACPTELKNLLKTAAPPYLYSGPSPIGLAGDRPRRLRRQRRPRRCAARRPLAQDRPGPHAPSTGSASTRRIAPGSRSSRSRSRGTRTSTQRAASSSSAGIYVTLAAYPLVPKTEVGFRIQITAANSQAEIEQLVDVVGKLANAFDLRPAGQREYAA